MGTGPGRTPTGKKERYLKASPRSSVLSLFPKTGTSGLKGIGGYTFARSKIDSPAWFQSSMNRLSPESVRGCLKSWAMTL